MKRILIIQATISKLPSKLKISYIRFLLFICCVSGIQSIKAQQEPMYSQYMFNMTQINPAYAGNRAVNNVTALYRKQWVNIDGAPTTASLSWDARAQESNIGYGIQIYNDKLGVESTTGFQAFYSYRIPFKNSSLALGISAGILNYKAGLTNVQTVTSDPLFSENVNNLLPTVGLGVLYASDRWYAGLSIPALLSTKVNPQNYQITKSASDHYFLTGGYIFDVSEAVKLKPSVPLPAVKGSPLEYDFNLHPLIQHTVGFGVSYRTGDALIGMFELQLTPEFGFGYAYDYTISHLKTFNKGTHELMLRYEFGNKRNKRILSPRYY